VPEQETFKLAVLLPCGDIRQMKFETEGMQMLAGVVEVQNEDAFPGSDIPCTIPDPGGPVGQHHRQDAVGMVDPTGELHMNAVEELIGVFDSACVA